MSSTVLAIGSFIVIVGIGIWVRDSGMRQRLGNILIPCSLIAVSLIFLAITVGFTQIRRVQGQRLFRDCGFI